jgi:hypothetical protein
MDVEEHGTIALAQDGTIESGDMPPQCIDDAD